MPVFTVVDDIPQATGDDTTIKVGASPTPHAEILNAAKDLFAARVGRSRSLSSPTTCSPTSPCLTAASTITSKTAPAYLDNYNEENGTDLVGVAKIHFEAMALYGGKAASRQT